MIAGLKPEQVRDLELPCAENTPVFAAPWEASAFAMVLALYRAERQVGTHLIKRDARADIARAVDILARRQRSNGGIGYWSESDWTSAHLIWRSPADLGLI